MLDLYSETLGLEVKKSPIHGFGLFATKQFEDGNFFI